MRSQSKGIGSADNSASIRRNIHTIPALLHIGEVRFSISGGRGARDHLPYGWFSARKTIIADRHYKSKLWKSLLEQGLL
jgi:hypothetical protein